MFVPALWAWLRALLCPLLLQNPHRALLRNDSPYFVVGLCMAGVQLVMLLFVLGHFSWRLGEALRKGRRWSRRRRRISLLAFAQLVMQVSKWGGWTAPCGSRRVTGLWAPKLHACWRGVAAELWLA